jgi:hypothetical protein
MQSCIVQCRLRAEKQCQGNNLNLDDGDKSIVVMKAKSEQLVVNINSNNICQNHWNQLLRHKQDECIDPKCQDNNINKSLRKCPVRLLKCFNLHPAALVKIHQQCYNLFDERYHNHPSYQPKPHRINNSSNSKPLRDITNITRDDEIIAHNYITNQINNSSTNQPIKLVGKRGRSITILHIPKSHVDNNSASTSILSKRVKILDNVINILSTTPNNNNQDNNNSRVELLTAHMKIQKELYFQAIKSSGILNNPIKLSSNQAIQLKSITGMTWSLYRLINSFLKSSGIHILPTEKKIRDEQLKLRYELESNIIDFNKEIIRYVRVVDIAYVINDQIEALKKINEWDNHNNCIGDNEIWLNLLGDKGGYSCKLGLSLLNKRRPLSRDLLMLAMYEGAGEDYNIVKLVMGETIKQVYDWVNNTANGKVTIVFNGGDMKWLYMLLGLSSCGHHFCVYCTISRDDLVSGNPHHCELKQFPARNFGFHMEQLQQYELAGSNKDIAKQYYNCIAQPIVGAAAFRCIAPMPLHIFLGMGEICLNIITKVCIDLDQYLFRIGIKSAEEPNSKYIEDLYRRITEAENDIMVLEEHIQFLDDIKSESMVELNHNELLQLKTNMQSQIKHLSNSITSAVAAINASQGYFQHKLDKFLKIIKVTRKGNRGHSLVGSEVHKLFQPDNILAFTNIIREQSISTGSNNNNKYGNNIEAFKLQSLMQIFSTMYHLSTAPRRLKDAEIQLLYDQAKELGIIYPTNYPKRNITPKLHVLIYHIPAIAKQYKTVGLLGEHSIESTHREFNQYDRTYCNITDPVQSLVNSFYLHYLAIDARIGPKYTRPKRNCSKCGLALSKYDNNHCTC